MDLPPALTAALDQHRATLAECVSRVREHRKVCPIAGSVCCGAEMMYVIEASNREGVEGLLGLALCALADAQADAALVFGDRRGIDRLLAELDEEGTG